MRIAADCVWRAITVSGMFQAQLCKLVLQATIVQQDLPNLAHVLRELIILIRNRHPIQIAKRVRRVQLVMKQV